MTNTGVARLVHSDNKHFTSFEPIKDREKLFMEKIATSVVKEQGIIYVNDPILNNVLYVPRIYENLVSGSLLNKHDFRIVFE